MNKSSDLERSPPFGRTPGAPKEPSAKEESKEDRDPSVSASVWAVKQRLERTGKPVSAWQIVKELLQDHPDFPPPELREVLLALAGPPRSRQQAMSDWLELAKRQLNPSTTPELHGKLFIVVLARLDPDLEQFLEKNGALDPIRKGIKEPLETLLIASSPNTNRDTLPDSAPWQLDTPTVSDRLGRQGFARAVALRLDRIWNDYSSSGARGSFAMQLHGPWGAGKTSLLNMLRSELKPSARSELTSVKQTGPRDVRQMDSRWIVVDFNAWQHQRLDPPWWFLMDSVYREALDQIRQRPRGLWHALKLRLWESGWRFVTGRRDIMTIFSVSLLFIGILSLLLLWFPDIQPKWIQNGLNSISLGTDPEKVDKSAKAFSTVIALIGTLLGPALWLSRSLLSGSARAAQAFVESGADPMKQISRHFDNLVRRIGHPIMIMIDDLDRCQPAYVVHLLEGIQTLFPNPRVFYVMAADRRWLQASFEKQYDSFATAISEPGRRLGSLFLEKAFELSVAVPRLSEEVQKAFWGDLIGGSTTLPAVGTEDPQEAARQEFIGADSEQDVVALVGQKDLNPAKQQARRQAAVERLASVRVEQSTQYFLHEFAHLLEPNPRAMKRLLNAYSVQRDFALLGGLEDLLGNAVMRKKLVLWTILCMRWPALEDLLVKEATVRKGEIRPLEFEDAPSDLQALLRSQPVLDVLNGRGIGVALDFEWISTWAGLGGLQTRTGSTVA